MPPSTPYSTTVVDAVETALKGVTTAGGYNNTLVYVKRADRASDDDGQYPSARIIRAEETKVRNVGGEWTVNLTVVIRARADTTKEPLRPTDEAVALLTHDIDIALSNMDFPTLEITLETIDHDLYPIEKDDPIDGADISAVFLYGVDYKAPQTIQE